MKKALTKTQGSFTTLLLLVILFAGISLLLYPGISNHWNSLHATKAITTYADDVSQIDSADYDRMWQEAIAYNTALAAHENIFALTDTEKAEYEQLLNISGHGIMGYIEIPAIEVSLPIYHGTDESVLQVAIGHLEWSSLPTGGPGTHCVVSGHRGLPSSKLLTHLDKLTEGDIFLMRILDEVLTYEVDQILIVEPHETESLNIEPGKDLCTIVTCTPYGINTHRLLVRGHRIENLENANVLRVTAEAIQIEPLLVAPVLAAPVLLLLLILLLLPARPTSSTTITENHDTYKDYKSDGYKEGFKRGDQNENENPN